MLSLKSEQEGLFFLTVISKRYDDLKTGYEWLLTATHWH